MRRILTFTLLCLTLMCARALGETVPSSIVIEGGDRKFDLRNESVYTLTAYALPEQSEQAIQWSSSAPGVVSVDGGTLTLKRPGKAVITAASAAQANISAKITVTVVDTGTASSVTIHSKAITIEPNENMHLTAQVNPDTAVKGIRWESTNEKIATVSEDGIVTGLAVGSAYIRAFSVYTEGLYSQIRVTVAYSPAPNRIKINNTETNMEIGEVLFLDCSITPDSACQELTFESSDPEVASVSENGVITAKAYGEVRISAVSVRNKAVYGAIKLFVNDVNVPSEIRITPGELTLEPTQTGVLAAETYPEEAQSGVVWESSNENVAIVDQFGAVTAVGTGKCKIYAYSELTRQKFGEAQLSARYQPVPKSIKLNTKELSLTKGETFELIHTMNAENVSQVVGYDVSNPEAVTVENGLLTAVGSGEATVTVYALANRRVQAKVKVSVFDPDAPEKIEVESGYIRLKPGEFYLQYVIAAPETASPAVTWTSDDERVVSVDEFGVLTANGSGITTVTCTSLYNRALSLNVTVLVENEDRELVMPERRTDVSGIEANLARIESVKQSAYKELQTHLDDGAIDDNEYEARAESIENAFEMYAFPWMAAKVRKYWNAENSEDGAKDFKPDIVYYGMPYISGNNVCRRYTLKRAVDEEIYLWQEDKGYYLLNHKITINGKYAGSDCSSFVGMALFGYENEMYSFPKTPLLYTDKGRFKTVKDWEALRPGDLLVKYNTHVVIFLYYANEDKSQIVVIEQGGAEPAINTVSAGLYRLDHYADDYYIARRLKKYA